MQFFKDKDGNQTLFQPPNLPLSSWLILTLLSKFTSDHHLKSIFSLVAMAFLFTWAYLELTKGESYFRRILGGIVLVVTIIGFVRH